MGNKLKSYISSLQQLLNSGEKIENPEALKNELYREIVFWQHERIVHLIVTFLFAIATVAVLLTIAFMPTIPLFLLFVMLLVLLLPYIWHYYILENGVQTLYVIYEELCRRYPQPGVPPACVPELYGVKLKDDFFTKQ